MARKEDLNKTNFIISIIISFFKSSTLNYTINFYTTKEYTDLFQRLLQLVKYGEI